MKNLIIGSIAILTMLAGTSVFAAVAIPGTYSLDTAHTNIGFRVSHMGVSYTVGRFNTFDGSFKFEPNGDSNVTFSVDINSVDTNNERRDGHLKSADFFNLARFPRMTFQSTRVEYDVDGNPTKLEGDLTLHGTTNNISLDVETVGVGEDQLGRTHSGFVARGVIQRSEFGMDKLLFAASDEVQINVDIEGILN